MFRLFFGESTPEEVISTAGNNEKQKCEANLYLGEYYRLHGNRAQAQSSFQSVTESCSETLLESRIARAELKRMEDLSPPPRRE
jgi:lipoprotein NlpI